MIVRFIEQRLPLAVAISAALATVVGLLLRFHSTTDRLAVVAGIALLTLWGDGFLRGRRLKELLEFKPCRKPELTPEQFGSKPSPIARTLFPDADAPYVTREEDIQIGAALRLNPFVVIAGVTNSGKTRAAFEAIGQT